MVRRGRPQEGRAPRNRSTPNESFGGKGGARDGGNFGTGAMQMQMQMQMQPCFSIDGSEKTERRTAIFERTKMCKFFILGLCAKGPECRFAHDKCELNGCPDLFRTKLCKTLINTGSCDDPNCRYAHTKVELRDTPADEDEVEHRLPADANTPQRTQHAIGLAGALPKGPLPQGQSGFRNAPAPQISQGQGNPNGMQQANMTPANQAAMWQTMIQAASMQANQARQLQAMVMAQMQASGHLAGGTQPGQQQMPQMGSLFPGFMPGMVTWPGPVAEQGGAAASSASPAQTFAPTPPTNPNFMQQQQQQRRCKTPTSEGRTFSWMRWWSPRRPIDRRLWLTQASGRGCPSRTRRGSTPSARRCQGVQQNPAEPESHRVPHLRGCPDRRRQGNCYTPYRSRRRGSRIRHSGLPVSPLTSASTRCGLSDLALRCRPWQRIPMALLHSEKLVQVSRWRRWFLRWNLLMLSEK